MKLPKIFRIQSVKLSDGDELVERISKMQSTVEHEGVLRVELSELMKTIAEIATYVWRAKARTVDPVSGETREEMKRIHGDMERIYKCFDRLGIVVKDHTGEAFDYGLPLKVITTQPMAIPSEIVTETLKPTIYLGNNIIQHGEVEIGTPIQPEKSR